MQGHDIVVAGAARTAVGSFNGALANVPAHVLGQSAIAEALGMQQIASDTAKVNVNGGAIAIGHPIGASGARIFVTLLHEMQKRDVRKGLATLCIGGGMGIAMCVER